MAGKKEDKSTPLYFTSHKNILRLEFFKWKNVPLKNSLAKNLKNEKETPLVTLSKIWVVTKGNITNNLSLIHI